MRKYELHVIRNKEKIWIENNDEDGALNIIAIISDCGKITYLSQPWLNPDNDKLPDWVSERIKGIASVVRSYYLQSLSEMNESAKYSYLLTRNIHNRKIEPHVRDMLEKNESLEQINQYMLEAEYKCKD